MTKQRKKKGTSLEVHVMFEPTRLEHACLQKAYAWVVPCVRKHLATHQTRQPMSGERSAQ
jgi:hypothetical protein